MGDWIELIEGPLDQARVARHLEDPGAGGRVIFAGHVRPEEDGREIEGLLYEHYPPMALRQMQRLAEELRAQWPILRLALVHRVGFIPAGEAAVLIGVACERRASAFAAAERAIARLKEIVPLWKGA
jgi:molybdopterin synthase catalytic subunit